MFSFLEEFLSNPNKMQQLIKLLAKYFRGGNPTVIEFEGDEDTQNVTSALFISCQKQRVILIAHDTNILGLLLYFWNSEMSDIILQSIPKNKGSMINTRNVFSHLNKTVGKSLLIHAWER